MRIRQRTVYKILRDLDASSGTGPDGLPTKILKQCASQLSLPVTLLSRLCLSQGRWPLCWRTHWIHPLHKRNSRADAANYRGVHLTAQLSKAVERAVGSVFVPWLAKHGFGEHQYAYTRQRSHRDVLAINVCNWLLLLEAGFSVGLFCSDVSGAFDRVRRQRLCDKLAASGLPSGVVKFLASWLEDRISNVIVAGALSPDTVLADSVLQGIATNSACNDSIVRCIGMIVASNLSRSGLRAASILAAIEFAKSVGLTTTGKELCTTGCATDAGPAGGARMGTTTGELEIVDAATAPSALTRFGIASVF